jgi:hypothetical protein
MYARRVGKPVLNYFFLAHRMQFTAIRPGLWGTKRSVQYATGRMESEYFN